MTRSKLSSFHPKIVRDALNRAVQITETLKSCEADLIAELSAIDQHRFFTRYGYNSMRGFCNAGLGLSRFHAQRIVTQVRKYRLGNPSLTDLTESKPILENHNL